MNILTDALPTAVMIGDQKVSINTDFRDCLRVILAFEDVELTPTEQMMILIDNLYPGPLQDAQLAVQQGVKFLNGGEAAQDSGSGAGESLRLYGFAHDANLIYAAFQQTHGIDLEAVDGLHWWKFLALFMDLGAETAFCQLVGLRKRVLTGKATKEEKAQYREMRDVAEIPEPDTRTAAEREQEDEFMRVVLEAQQRKRDERQKQKEETDS